MTNEERKPIVKELLAKGLTLSQIQDYFHKEKNDPIKYMDLRLLLSEMPDAQLPEKELLKTVLPPAAPAAGAGRKACPKRRGAGSRRQAFDQCRSSPRTGLDAERVCAIRLRRQGALVPR